MSYLTPSSPPGIKSVNILYAGTFFSAGVTPDKVKINKKIPFSQE